MWLLEGDAGCWAPYWPPLAPVRDGTGAPFWPAARQLEPGPFPTRPDPALPCPAAAGPHALSDITQTRASFPLPAPASAPCSPRLRLDISAGLQPPFFPPACPNESKAIPLIATVAGGIARGSVEAGYRRGWTSQGHTEN